MKCEICMLFRPLPCLFLLFCHMITMWCKLHLLHPMHRSDVLVLYVCITHSVKHVRVHSLSFFFYLTEDMFQCKNRSIDFERNAFTYAYLFFIIYLWAERDNKRRKLKRSIQMTDAIERTNLKLMIPKNIL